MTLFAILALPSDPANTFFAMEEMKAKEYIRDRRPVDFATGERLEIVAYVKAANRADAHVLAVEEFSAT